MRALMKSLSLCLTALMLMAWPNPSVKGEETVVLRDEDLTITYDPSSAFQVDLSAESGDFIITQAGTYVLTGSLTGQLAIQTDAKALVRLVLNNATIFNPKGVAVYGLTAGALLYGTGFLTVGGEWFAMWQSVSWNGQNNAHIFFMLGAVALLHLSGPEA